MVNSEPETPCCLNQRSWSVYKATIRRSFASARINIKAKEVLKMQPVKQIPNQGPEANPKSAVETIKINLRVTRARLTAALHAAESAPAAIRRELMIALHTTPVSSLIEAFLVQLSPNALMIYYAVMATEQFRQERAYQAA
jgi:hypothetical protein